VKRSNNISNNQNPDKNDTNPPLGGQGGKKQAEKDPFRGVGGQNRKNKGSLGGFGGKDTGMEGKNPGMHKFNFCSLEKNFLPLTPQIKYSFLFRVFGFY
jgi:hypothetical protein